MRIESMLAQVRAFDASDAARPRILELLRSTPAPCSRKQLEPGHMTASGIVLSPDRTHVLLLLHEKLGRWLQPGGHVDDDDTTLLDTARREVAEETGVALDDSVEPVIAGMDVHEIPAHGDEAEHLHHDVMWQLFAKSDAIHCSPESREVRWVPLADLDRFSLDRPLLAAIARAGDTSGVRPLTPKGSDP